MRDALRETEVQETILDRVTRQKCLGFLTAARTLFRELGRDAQIHFA